MNQKHSILNLFVSKGKGQFVAHRKISTLLVGLLAVLLVVLATSVVVSTGEPAAEKTDAAFLAANPELMFARRYFGAAAKSAEVSFLAANPELMFARRYFAEAAKRANVAFLAANPELMFARRYAAEAAKRADAAFLAANPEIMVYRRYVAATAGE